MILVSACLLGENVKYNGKNNLSDLSKYLLQRDDIYPICPEVLGGLAIPRNPSEIKNNKVVDNQGKDVTKQFRKGAEKTLQIALQNNVKLAILMERSPSCGVHKIYDGSFQNKLIDGAGITTKLLQAHGINVITVEEYIQSNNK